MFAVKASHHTAQPPRFHSLDLPVWAVPGVERPTRRARSSAVARVARHVARRTGDSSASLGHGQDHA